MVCSPSAPCRRPRAQQCCWEGCPAFSPDPRSVPRHGSVSDHRAPDEPRPRSRRGHGRESCVLEMNTLCLSVCLSVCGSFRVQGLLFTVRTLSPSGSRGGSGVGWGGLLSTSSSRSSVTPSRWEPHSSLPLGPACWPWGRFSAGHRCLWVPHTHLICVTAAA